VRHFEGRSLFPNSLVAPESGSNDARLSHKGPRPGVENIDWSSPAALFAGCV